MKPLSHNLLDAARGVRAALDAVETTENIAELADAVRQALARLDELMDASVCINRYLEALIVQAKSELGDA